MTFNPLTSMISYRWSTSRDAEVLHRALALRGFLVAHDRCSWNAGTPTPLAMDIGVSTCDALLALLTPSFLYPEVSAGSPRPALDQELLPAIQRRRRSLEASTSKARPVVVPIFKGWDSRPEAGTAVHAATGHDLGSYWNPHNTLRTKRLGTAEASAISAATLRAVLASADGLNESNRPFEVVLATRGAGQPPRQLNVDATSFLGRDRYPGSEREWEAVLRALCDVEQALSPTLSRRRLSVLMKSHLTASFAFGRVFNQAAGWQLEVEGRHGPTSPLPLKDYGGLRVSWDAATRGTELVVGIDVLGHPVSEMATAATGRLGIPSVGHLQLSIDPRELSPTDVRQLASTIGWHIRARVRETRPTAIHLFAAAPVELVCLIGHRMTALDSSIVLYERDAAAYGRSMTIPHFTP